MSSKNRLQEFFQKRGLPLPKYTTSRAGGPDHKPIWVCQIQLPDGDIVMGSPESSRRAAELSAAEDALTQITGDEEEYEDSGMLSPDLKTVILIDIENQPKALEEILNLETTNITVFGFISTGHPLIDKIEGSDLNEDKRFTWWIVNSTRKNAADIGMSYATGIMAKTYQNFVIISGDSFSDVLADCLNQDNKTAYACRSAKYAIEKLYSL
jgi:hypothetical protein